MAKSSNKERILKAARERKRVLYKENRIRLIVQQKFGRPEESGMIYSKC